ncbi:hypothetical protein F8388_020948 [Cannabis sativa]|uniref:Zinc finger PHD-type domain-containing protein n=1 Tax=Cannabis sativa TaxID=3483 RepID=A0A7J6FKI9_CANSA|nr:hypothetical protein F8388_020948 [Cannabis sativa]
MSREIQHYSHNHLLDQLDDIQYVSPKDFIITCNLCELRIDDNKKCYVCRKGCVYALHKICAEFPQYLDHVLHPEHGHLMLQKRSIDDTSKCYYCENSFQNQQTLAYICTQCSLHIHTTCALIPIPTLIRDNDNDTKVQYLCHQHPMSLVEHDQSKDQAQCFVCQSIWSGLAYSCSSPGCKNFLHYSCANFQSKIDHHPSHSHHPLILQFSMPQSCNVCCKKDCRLIFRCHSECNFNLCTECVVPKITVRCQSHDHSLSFVEKAFYKGICNACQKSYTQWSSECVVPKEVKRTQSILFRCVECDFNLHFLCGPLPSIIKFDYHIHSLTLVDHYIPKDDHNDEFYCDICEEERDPYIRIYCCKDCDFAAHIHCLLIEIMKIIKGSGGSINDVKLMALGECGWTESSIDTNDVLHTTLGEYLTNTLTHQHNALLSNPFTFDCSSQDKTDVDQWYKSYTQANYLLFDNQFRSSIEKIYQINHFPSFTSNHFKNFFFELLYYRPKEGLKLDEKYLRQKVVDIKGYKVPLTLAHILNTLLHRYTESDLFGESVWNWTPGIKSVFATTFCMVCDQMCRTNINDITKHVLQDWFFYLNVIAGTRYRNAVRLTKFIDKIMKRFFCFEAMRYEKDIKEKLQGRIADLKAELKKCEEKLDTFNTHISQTLEKIKSPINDALSLKEKTVDQIIGFDELLYSKFESVHFP